MAKAYRPIAIVGMSCRFPGSDTLDAFRQLLEDGRDAIIDIPPERWNLDALRGFNDGNPLPSCVTRGGWLTRVRDFDNTFFRMSPREVRAMDPKQRLVLEVAHEALEHGGFPPRTDRMKSTGVFVGTAQSEYLMRFYNRGEMGGAKSDRYSGPGNDCSFTAGRISGAFGFEGPSVNVNTACSTSLVAVHQACQALQTGECEFALAGGVSVIESPEHTLTMNAFGIIAPDSKCKAFSADANGYVRAEGCGIVVLRPLEDAQRDGDTIYGVIAGSAVNHVGETDQLHVPDADAQERLLERALSVGGLKGSDVDVIEAHGTGTSVGDPIEITALSKVFLPGRPKDRPLTISSVKTNVGHLEVSAGVAGLIKATLQLQHREIYPHLHLSTVNPAIDMSQPLRFPMAREGWDSAHGPRRAAVNSFGISGINAAVIVEEAPSSAPVTPKPGSRWVLPLSGYSESAVRELATAYLAKLPTAPAPQALLQAAALRRAHHPLRIAVAATTLPELLEGLEAVAQGAPHPAVCRGEVREAQSAPIWLFTGQGSQWIGMGKALYEAEPVFKEALDLAADALSPHLPAPLLPVLFGEDTRHDLSNTAWTQPALFAFEWAMAQLWLRWIGSPSALMGHSIGEIAAACVAGVFSLDDGAKMVAARGRLMASLPEGGSMAAVFGSADQVQPVLAAHGDRLAIASDNGPTTLVISGEKAALDQALDTLRAKGIESRPLTVSHAFHSPLMDPILGAFREVVESLSFHEPTLPLLSNLTGRLETAAFCDPEYWVRHIREPVRFRETLTEALHLTHGAMMEIGPRPSLVGMGRRANPQAKTPWIGTHHPERPLNTLYEALGSAYVQGLPVRWEAWWADHPMPRTLAPTYPFQRREFWLEDPGPSAAPAQPSATPHGATPYTMSWACIETEPGVGIKPGVWIAALDEAGTVSSALTTLTALGHTVITVRRPDQSIAADQTLDPLSAEAIEALMATAGSTLRGWINGWALDERFDEDASEEALLDQQRRLCGHTLLLSQALHRRPEVGQWTLTQGADAVRPGEAPNLSQSPLWGLLRVVSLEHRPKVNLRIDLCPEGDHGPWADLLLTPPADDQIALRNGRRYGLRLSETPLPRRPFPLPASQAWVITGGLGALGLAVAEHLIGRGVKRLALWGRSGPKAEAQQRIEAWRARGVEIRHPSVDVSSFSAVHEEIQTLTTTHGWDLRGVVHAAGTLADGRILSQTPDQMMAVFPAKMLGAWALHKATAHLTLDAFVLFSSVSSTLGAPGQGNYAAANAFMDALAWSRVSSNRPGLSVNWGPWGEIGMAAKLASLMASRGMGGLKTAEALALMDSALDTRHGQLTIMDIRLEQILQQSPDVAKAPLFGHLLGDLAPKGAPSPAPTPAPSVVPAAVPPRQRVIALISDLLRVKPEELALERPLAWQGFDSIMAVDLYEALQRDFEVSFTLDTLTTGPSPEELLGMLTPRQGQLAPPTAAPSLPQASVLEILQREVAALLGTEPADVQTDRPLAWQGFDSILAVDLYQRLNDLFGTSPSVDILSTGPRLDELEGLLGDVHLPTAAPIPQANAPRSASSGKEGLREIVAALLGFSVSEVDPQRPLAWQGFDSIMAVDLHDRLAAQGQHIAVDYLATGPSIAEIQERLGEPALAPAPQDPVPQPAVQTPVPAMPSPPPTPALPAAVSEPNPVEVVTQDSGTPPNLWLAIGSIVLAAILATGWVWFANKGAPLATTTETVQTP